ncbi:MAG TPA: glycine cleavage system aminomethyltransferase GcvT, partial [Opitutales bacterium]|nr:glycine cleavage system aminomethyltransferase GcvT [Opitutales bacterium]
FSGWEMPVQYTGIIEEHKAARTAAGLFDVSHMGEALVSGPQALEFLDYVATNRLADLAVGRARYTLLCAPDGGVVDDIIVYRTGPQDFLLCLNAGNTPGDVAWLKTQAAKFDCEFKDASAKYAQLALQGPRAVEIAAGLAPANVRLADVPRFSFVEIVLAGVPLLASRTGYTGEDGFEFYLPPDQAEAFADALLEAGAPAGLKPCGLGARDSLRLEAGLPLYGHEISREISPIQAGLGWAVKLDKPGGFIGRDALAAETAAKPARCVIFFVLDDRRMARADMVVSADGRPVGKILSGTLSPILNQPIGSALVARAALDSGASLTVDIRGTAIPLRLAKPPLHKIPR